MSKSPVVALRQSARPQSRPQPAPPAGLSALDAILGRQSIRAFLPTPVPLETVERILEVASRSPSGSNMQPWRVWVLTGDVKERLTAELYHRHMSGDDGAPEWAYYPEAMAEPYLSRRRATGWGLYGVLGIPKGDRAATRRQQARNYRFFDAPVGLVFTIGRGLALGSWIDYGCFLQTVMLAARAYGLETCPQAVFRNYHDTISRRLAIPPDQMIVTGMALGYADPDAPVNRFRTDRAPVSTFMTVPTELRADGD